MAAEPTMRSPSDDVESEPSDSHNAAVAGEPLAARTTQLLAANEQLVVTALRAQSAADVATLAFEALSRSSQLDPLTDLPNRQSLLSRFAYAMAIARRTGTQLALLFVDLNDFKQINDMLGHGAGDQVLRLVAKRLAAAVRESDTVSRHGGDEFLILLTEVSHASDVVQIATKLISALGRSARVGDHVFRLRASIGISLFPRDGANTETLIRRADAAMYRAKRSGAGGFIFHGRPSDEDQTPSPRRLALHHPLSQYRAALAAQARRHGQLRDANEQLVLAVLRARRLQEAAEQTQRRQTELLERLANELRNPPVPMQIERQVAHMSRLVGDLLDVSRSNAGSGMSPQRGERVGGARP